MLKEKHVNKKYLIKGKKGEIYKEKYNPKSTKQGRFLQTLRTFRN